jgi:PDDEXK-like domain of unknown function (DUF3799)
MQINPAPIILPSRAIELPAHGLVHGLPNAAYQRAASISQSQLKAFRKSPFHFQARYLEPVPEVFQADDEEDTSGNLFAGTLCHCATLEPDEFDKRYLVGPKVKTRAAKVWKDFVEAHPAHTVITEKQRAIAFGQAASLRRLDAVIEILEGGRCEVSAFWKDPITGLHCRCRPDCVNGEFGSAREPLAMILDVKSTQDASKQAVKLSIARYGYHHQAEWYSRGYTAASGIPVAGFVFAFVEGEYPFAASVFELEPDAWDVATRENRDALDQLARCRNKGKWPSYSPDVENVGLPRWAGGRGDY